jgi:hemerythrin
MINWKDSFAIGNKMIDDQHKMLFDLCDKIMDLHQDQYAIDKYDRIMALYHVKYHMLILVKVI